MSLHTKPLGPTGLFDTLRQGWQFRAQPLETLTRWHAEYGDVVAFDFPGAAVRIFMHPDQIHELLVERSEQLRKPTVATQAFARWLGRGLVLDEGESWTRQRKRIQSSLQKYDLAHYARLVVEQTRETFVAGEKGRVEVCETADRLAYSIAVRSSLGESGRRRFEELLAAANVLQVVGVRDSQELLPPPDWLPLPSRRRKNAALDVYYRILRESVQEHERSPPAPGQPSDHLDLLLQTRRESSGDVAAGDSTLEEEIASLLFGGKETAASAILWTVYCLAKNPQVQEVVADEIRRVLGERDPTQTDIAQLGATQRAWQEALRLFPPVAVLARQAAASFELAGVGVPRNAFVLISLWNMQRDARWYSEPQEYRPERFLSATDSPASTNRYLPFGDGPRVCVGRRMGTIQGILTTACILQRYRVEWDPREPEPEIAAGISIYPKRPMWVRMSPR